MSEYKYNDWFEFQYQNEKGETHEGINAKAYDSELVQLFFDHHIGRPEDDGLQKGDLVMKFWANMPSTFYVGNFHHLKDQEMMRSAQANCLRKLIQTLNDIKEQAEKALENL